MASEVTDIFSVLSDRSSRFQGSNNNSADSLYNRNFRGRLSGKLRVHVKRYWSAARLLLFRLRFVKYVPNGILNWSLVQIFVRIKKSTSWTMQLKCPAPAQSDHSSHAQRVTHACCSRNLEFRAFAAKETPTQQQVLLIRWTEILTAVLHRWLPTWKLRLHGWKISGRLRSIQSSQQAVSTWLLLSMVVQLAAVPMLWYRICSQTDGTQARLVKFGSRCSEIKQLLSSRWLSVAANILRRSGDQET